MRILIIPTILSLLVACKHKQPKLESEKGLKVRFEVKNFQQQLGECDRPDGDCAQVDMTFPLAVAGVPAVAKSINDSIYHQLILSLVFESFRGPNDEAGLKRAATDFLHEWQSQNSGAGWDDNENAPASIWEVTVTGEVGLHTPKMACITIGAYSYAGGAHPNSYVTILNFDLNTGKIFRWEDFISDTPSLRKKAEAAFKKARELPPSADLLDEGFFWGEHFVLPQNFELQEEGIYFWYNPFEVGAYALGPTDFLLTYDELGKLFKREVIF